MAITSWTNLLLPRLPGASKTLVEAEIVKTIENFCRDSTAWRDTLYGFDVTAGQREISVIVDDGSQLKVVGLLRVYYNQKQLTQYSHTPWETSTNYPSGWTTKPGDPSTIMLSTIPIVTDANSIDVLAYLRPVDPVNITVDMTLLTEDFWEIIFDGVMGRMLSQNDKPYSNATSAAYHLSRYRHGTRKARDMANRGFTGNAQNWVFPKFGR